MNIAITGATGFIGKHLINSLAKNIDHKIIALTIPDPTIFDKSIENVKFVITDFSVDDLNKYLSNVEVLIHLAGLRMPKSSSYVDLSFFYDANIKLTENLLLSAKFNSVKKFIQASSIAVYGNESKGIPMKEETPLSPANNYGVSKVIAELLASTIAKGSSLKIVSFRFAQIFGIGEREDLILNSFIKKSINDEPIHINVAGYQKRDYVYILDVINAFKLAINNPDIDGIFNIGQGVGHSAAEIAENIRDIFNPNAIIKYPDSIEKIRETEFIMNIDKSDKLLGWSPKFNLNEALLDMKSKMNLSNI